MEHRLPGYEHLSGHIYGHLVTVVQFRNVHFCRLDVMEHRPFCYEHLSGYILGHFAGLF